MKPPQQVGVGTVLGGDYRLLKPLGAGGMGVVYLAEQLSTSKQRAVKVMRSTLVDDDKQRERFVREAKATAAIDSAHVVEVISAGVSEGGVPWLAMELMQGRDLGDYLQEGEHMPLPQLLTLFEQLCHALDAAHAASIVHRDIKPENIYLARTRRVGGELTVKVLDFGIAKMVDAAKTGGTAALGSPMWMAPEQTNPDVPISAATDVWAIGLLAYWALTGTTYWKSAKDGAFNIHEMLREVLFDPLQLASRRLAENGGDAARLPAGFDDWFERCVHREPRARFASASEAYAGLSALGDGSREPLVDSQRPETSSLNELSSGVAGSTQDGESEPETDGLSTNDFLDGLALGTNHVLREYRPSAAAAGAPERVDGVAALAVEDEAAPAATHGDTMAAVLAKPTKSGASTGIIAGVSVLAVVAGLAGWLMLGEDVRDPDSVIPPPDDSAVTDITPSAEPPVPSVSPPPTASVSSVPTNVTSVVVPPPPAPRPVVRPRPAPTSSVTASASAKPRPPFNRAAADRAVRVQTQVTARTCASRPGPRAIGGSLLMAPAGHVQSVNVALRDRVTGTGGCVKAHMHSVRVPAFSGPPQSVGFAVVMN